MPSIPDNSHPQKSGKSRNSASRWILILLLLLIAGLGTGFGIYRFTRASEDGPTKERELIGAILHQSNREFADWVHQTPAERFDRALGEIAKERKIPESELRQQLDKYASRIDADPSVEPEDRYHTLVYRHDFFEAGNLAGEKAAALQRELKSSVPTQPDTTGIANAKRTRLIDFRLMQGDAHFTNIATTRLGAAKAAMSAYQSAISFADRKESPEQWRTAIRSLAPVVNVLAGSYTIPSSEAEPVIRQAIAITEETHGQNHPETAFHLLQLSRQLLDTNQAAEAEPLVRRSLAIYESYLGKDHPKVALSLLFLCRTLGSTDPTYDTEPLIRRALAIQESHFGSEHPYVSETLHSLGYALLKNANQRAEAEVAFRRALEINEAAFGKNDPSIAWELQALADCIMDENPIEAEALLRRAIAIGETSLEKYDTRLADYLHSLSVVYQNTNRAAEGEEYIRRAIFITEIALGKEHIKVASRLNSLGALLIYINRLPEAEPVLRRALEIRQASLDKDHPSVGESLNNLARVLKYTNRLTEAEPMMRRVLEISEKTHGPNHPTVATGLNNLSLLLMEAKRLNEAEPLLRRALSIDGTQLGVDHPDFGRDLNNIAQLYADTNRLAEAESISLRAVAVFMKYKVSTGHWHLHAEGVGMSYLTLAARAGLQPNEAINRLNYCRTQTGLTESDFRAYIASVTRKR